MHDINLPLSVAPQRLMVHVLRHTTMRSNLFHYNDFQTNMMMKDGMPPTNARVIHWVLHL